MRKSKKMKNRCRIAIALATLCLLVQPGLFAQASTPTGQRTPLGSLPVLYPDLAQSSMIQYWKPGERVDLYTQAAAAVEGPTRTNTGGATLEAPDNKPLAVVESGPQGRIAEGSRPQIYLVFSQPMIPVAKLGAPQLEIGGISIEPPLDGEFRWISTKSVTFEPASTPIPLVQYRVTVDARLKSLYGKALPSPFVLSFHSGELRMVSIQSMRSPALSLHELPPDDRKELILVFNQPVYPSLIAPFISVRSTTASYQSAVEGWDAAAGAGTIKLTTMLKLSIVQPIPENTRVEVCLAAGAKADRVSIPTETEHSISFHTLYPFTIQNASGTQQGLNRLRADDANPVWLFFSHPVDAASIAGAVSIRNTSTAASGTANEALAEKRARRTPGAAVASATVAIPPEAIEVFGSRVRINGLSFDKTDVYEVSVSQRVKDIYGRNLENQTQFTFRIGNTLSFAHFPHRYNSVRMMEASFPPKTLAEVQDVEYLSFGAESVSQYREFNATPPLMRRDLSALPPQTRHFEVIDLKPYLNKDGFGWVRTAWEAKTTDRYPRTHRAPDTAFNVQVTDLAATVRVAYNQVLVLVTSLSTGKPVPGARVHLMDQYSERKSAATDARGLAAFSLQSGEYLKLFYTRKSQSYPTEAFMVEVLNGSDRIQFYPTSHDSWRYSTASTTSIISAERVRTQIFLYSDRKIYRPGETLKFRSIARDITLGAMTPRANKEVWVSLISDNGDEVGTVSGRTSASGGFWGEITIPENNQPGGYRLNYHDSEAGNQNRIQRSESIIVANFRRQQFQANFETSSQPSFADTDISATLVAEYLAGGSLQGASYSGYWTKEPYWFNAVDARWKSYRFSQSEYYGERASLSSFSGQLDGEGRARIVQKAAPEGVEGKIYLYRVKADIVDPLTGLAVSANTSVVVYPSSFILGARARKGSINSWWSYYSKGDTVTVDAVLVNPDGTLVSGAGRNVRASVVRHEWKTVQQQGIDGIDTRWTRVDVPVLDNAYTLTNGQGTFNFKPDTEGQYQVTLSAKDAQDRVTSVTFSIWVVGNRWINWYGSNPGGIDLTPEKSSYHVGETARILMRSPLPAGTYLITTEREGILDHSLVEFNAPTQVLTLPIMEAHVPIVYLAVSSYSKRSGPPTHAYGEPDLDKPKGYFGLTQIRVETDTRRLDLELVADKPSYRPGEKATFTVTARNKGKPVVGAEICFMAVDRGVVDIVDYHVPDPLAHFYNPSLYPYGVRGGDSRALLVDPVTYEVKDQFGGDGDDPKVEERKDFSPTAVFEPAVATGTDGTARISFTWPDNLTTYRCTAVAITADRFGLQEAESRVRNPINVKTALPRRMRTRDTTYSGVIVTNMDSKPQKVTVTCESSILSVDGPNTRTVTVPAAATMEVAFALVATKSGSGEIQFTTLSEVHNEKLTEPFVVEEPRLFEAVASIGSVTGNERAGDSVLEGLILPGASSGDLGSLEIALGSSKLPMLTGAVRYVLDYPYGCIEQRTARLMPIVAFGQYFEAFGLSSRLGNPRVVAEKTMAEIAAYQHADGSFGYWPWETDANIYVSARVAHILVLMEKNGWTPGGLNKADLLSYLRKGWEKYARFEVSYIMRLLAEAGELRMDELEAILRNTERFSCADWCQLGLAFTALGNKGRADYCLKKAMTFVKQAPRSMDVDWEGVERYYFNSKLTTLALLLDLTVRLNPESDIGRRIAETIVANQKSGYWANTNTTFWVLAAFAEAVRADGGKPDFTATVAIAGSPILSGTFRGISGRRETWRGELGAAPLNAFTRDTLLPFSFSKKGPGTLYYSAELNYSIPLETATNRSEGFEVVATLSQPDGSPLPAGPLKRGSLYKMTVHVSTDKDRTFVAVRMPVPSGADIVETFNPPFRYDEYGDYYEAYKLKIMDNEAHAYMNRMWAGTHSFSFLFRASAAGVYPVPPALAECMYEPEVFGRDVSTLVMIAK